MISTMHREAHIEHHTIANHKHKSFLTFLIKRTGRTLKILRIELRSFFILAYVMYFLQDFILSFTVLFERIKGDGVVPFPLNLGLLKPPLGVYILGTYLTPLPSDIVVPLAFFSLFFGTKKIMPFLGFVMIYTFFKAILI